MLLKRRCCLPDVFWTAVTNILIIHSFVHFHSAFPVRYNLSRGSWVCPEVSVQWYGPDAHVVEADPIFFSLSLSPVFQTRNWSTWIWRQTVCSSWSLSLRALTQTSTMASVLPMRMRKAVTFPRKPRLSTPNPAVTQLWIWAVLWDYTKGHYCILTTVAHLLRLHSLHVEGGVFAGMGDDVIFIYLYTHTQR